MAFNLSPDLLQPLVHHISVEILRIVFIQPLQHVRMLRVARVPDDLQEMVVSALSTAVLRRGRALALQADGMLQLLQRSEDLLCQDLMTPAISKVVLVGKLELLPGDDSVQLDLLLVLEIIAQHICLSGDDAVALTLYHELVQMAVIPAHDHLQNLVKLEQGNIPANLNSPPDERPYSFKGHF